MSALAVAPTGADENENVEQPKLFEIKAETTRPTKINVNISGVIELDLSIESDCAFYNSLKPGKTVSFPTDYYVASVKTTHRRDGDGNVDAVPQSKSIKVDLVHYDGAGEE